MSRWVFTAIPLVILFWIWQNAQQGPWDAMRITGCVLVVLGCLAHIAARLQLGSSFSVTPQAKKLVTGGIYSVIRHPVYVTGIVMLTGIVLYFERPVFLLAVVALAVAQFRRSRAEEAVLEAKFGQEYRDYRDRTWF